MTSIMNDALKASALALMLALAGCGSSQTTRYHSLEPQGRGAALADYSGPPVQIVAFNIPGLFDREEVMKATANGQYEALEFDHWAAPFGQMARQTFAQDLAARLPQGAVIFPSNPPPASATQLSINLIAYRVEGASAVLEVSWATRRATDPANAWQTTTSALKAPLPASDAAGTTAAVNDLLAQLADRVAHALRAWSPQ